jgi:hypothetical protein
MPMAEKQADWGPEGGIAARLDALDNKIDGLRALIEPLERLLDRNWRRHDATNAAGAPAAPAAAGDIAQLAAEFAQVIERRNRTWAELALHGSDAPWSPRGQAEADALIDPLWDQLLDLAGGLAQMRAQTSADIRAKAQALKELCEEKSDDIVHRLAASLANDLLRG